MAENNFMADLPTSWVLPFQVRKTAAVEKARPFLSMLVTGALINVAIQLNSLKSRPTA